MSDEPEPEFTPEEIALGEKIAEYYKNLDPNSPIPPDETKTHNFRKIIEQAQAEKTEDPKV